MSPAIGILIGGRSRRMGTPKALITIGGRTLLERTVETARSISDDFLLLGQPPFELPATLNALPVIPDRHAPIGPIGGLESLLLARPHSAGILLACDMPHLSAEVLKRLTEPGDDADAVVCSMPTAPCLHPCCARYNATCLAAVQEAIAAKQHGMMDLLARLRVRRVELTGDETRWVENWNEPRDMRPESPC